MNAKPWSVAWWTILLSTVAGVIAGLGAVVDMLPDTWRPTARIVIAVTGIVIALVLRSALFDSDGDGTPDALERPTQAPPPPTGGGSVAARARAAGIVIVALCVLAVPAVLLFTSGCGASALRAQATAADYTGIAIDAAGEQLVLARQHALARAVTVATREEAQAGVDAARARYAPLIASYDALRLTHDAWVSALVLAAAADLEDVPRWARLAARVVQAWDGWATAADALGLHPPRPPPMLLAIAAAALPAGGTP
jgi:hypothetical protein